MPLSIIYFCTVKRRNLYWIITLICISLLGIIAVQFLWIRNAIKVKEELFDRSVNDALGRVVNNLEVRESVRFLAQSKLNDSILTLIKHFGNDSLTESALILENKPEPGTSEKVVVKQYTVTKAIPPNQAKPEFQMNLPRKICEDYIAAREHQARINDSLLDHLQMLTVNIDPLSMNIAFEWDDQQIRRIDSIMRYQQALFEKQALDYRFETEWNTTPDVFLVPPDWSTPVPLEEDHKRKEKEIFLKARMDKLTNKAKKLQNVIQKMTIELESKPEKICDRISCDTLGTFLRKALNEKDIRIPFEYAVYTPSDDSLKLPIHSEGFEDKFAQTDHRVTLFPNDLVRKPAQLLVYFPTEKNHALKSVGWLMTGSILFTFIIVLSSAASIVVMIRQKKISDIKTDFINNMTHEFKTPIATISIATDSINNPKVITEPQKIRDFTRIIKDENNLMNARVEQVLQMALLDSRDFKLRPVVVDMNELIRRSAEHFRLQIEKREGSLQVEMDASNAMVEVDEDHMRNVLMNLLDNANKYSGSVPQIRVYSVNRGGLYLFGVEDKGIGMNHDTQRKVFDKFFRITEGNIHNIKGFGLGLSYVKAIVLAHHGEIQVYSEVGKGSRFEISLPVATGSVNGCIDELMS